MDEKIETVTHFLRVKAPLLILQACYFKFINVLIGLKSLKTDKPWFLSGGINISNFHHVKKLKSDLIAISEGLSSETDLIKITKMYAEN